MASCASPASRAGCPASASACSPGPCGRWSARGWCSVRCTRWCRRASSTGSPTWAWAWAMRSAACGSGPNGTSRRSSRRAPSSTPASAAGNAAAAAADRGRHSRQQRRPPPVLAPLPERGRRAIPGRAPTPALPRRRGREVIERAPVTVVPRPSPAGGGGRRVRPGGGHAVAARNRTRRGPPMTPVTVSSGRCPFAGVALACRDAATTSRSAMRRTLLPLLLCCLLPLSACAQAPAFPLEPDEARLVTEDIDRFWQAWDEAADATDAEARARILQARYLEPSSPGLETFLRLRIGDAGKLVAAIDAHPRYYASLRRLTPKLEDQVPRIRDTLRRMRTLVPDAVFPDVYFLVGRMNSGGTADATGLMIGVEMFGRAPGTPLDELGDWHRAVVGEFYNLPAI